MRNDEDDRRHAHGSTEKTAANAQHELVRGLAGGAERGHVAGDHGRCDAFPVQQRIGEIGKQCRSGGLQRELLVLRVREGIRREKRQHRRLRNASTVRPGEAGQHGVQRRKGRVARAGAGFPGRRRRCRRCRPTPIANGRSGRPALACEDVARRLTYVIRQGASSEQRSPGACRRTAQPQRFSLRGSMQQLRHQQALVHFRLTFGCERQRLAPVAALQESGRRLQPLCDRPAHQGMRPRSEHQAEADHPGHRHAGHGPGVEQAPRRDLTDGDQVHHGEDERDDKADDGADLAQLGRRTEIEKGERHARDERDAQ